MTTLPLLFALALVGLPPLQPPEVKGEKVDSGVYRFHGEGEFAAPPEPLLATVTAYDQQCQKGCRYTVPAVDRTEIVPGDKEGLFYTWSSIDDVLDAAYFARVEVSRDGNTTRVFFTTPDEATLKKLVDDKHPHDPFFYHQEGTWTLESLPVPAGEPPRTRVRVEIEMRSRSFVVNLLPGQILERTRKHLLLIYQYLGETAAAGTG